MKFRWPRVGRAACLVPAIATFLPVAHAADEGLEEVVVSARKRVEKAQDVPISLSEISGDELRRDAVIRVQDMVRRMPNVSTDILNPRQASIAIRGLGRNPANDALESSVGVFLDGVYLGRPGMMITDLVDLERVEVLRGPQGALFGKNATAGVLNIVTAPPDDETEGWIEVSAGDYAMGELRGAATGSIGASDWSYRVSGFATRRDGYVHDTVRDEWLGGLHRCGGRAQLQWQPGDSTTFRLIADYSGQDEKGPGYVLVDPNMYRDDGSLRATNLVTRGARLGYTPIFDPAARQNDADARQRVVTDNAGVALLADWDVGQYRLSSITGWRKYKILPFNDGDYAGVEVLPQLGNITHQEQVSEELRLASPTDGTFQYLAGLQFYGQRVDTNIYAVYGPDASAYLAPGLASSALDEFGVYTNTNPRTHSYSAFGQAYWWPRQDLEIAAGVRWTAEDKSATVEQATSGGATLAASDAAAIAARARLGSPQRYSLEKSEDFVSGSLSLTWHFGEQASAYLSAARGAKSGGVNAAILPAGADFTIDPEIALGYEAGIKTQWLERRLQLDAAVFYTTIDDYQASIRDRVVGSSYLANAGTVRTSGVEAEANYRPVENLTLSASAGYNDARYTSFRNAACPPELDNLASCDFTGQRVSGAPPLTLGGSIDYDRLLGIGTYRLRTRLEYSHGGGYRAELSRSTWIPEWDLVNLRATFATADDGRSLSFWVNNLFDEAYYSGMAVVGPGNTGVAIGLLAPPRMFGLSLQLRY